MDYEVTLLEDRGYIHVRASGDADRDSLTEIVKDLSRISSESRVKKFLVQYDAAPINLSTTAIYDLPEELEKEGWDRTQKVAIVLSGSDHPKWEDFKFFETTSRNQGFQTLVFDCPNTAANWLEEGR